MSGELDVADCRVDIIGVKSLGPYKVVILHRPSGLEVETEAESVQEAMLLAETELRAKLAEDGG